MHNANSEGTTPRECSTKHKVRERNAQSADSTVSSFVDSSAQHRLYILYIVPSIAVVIKQPVHVYGKTTLQGIGGKNVKIASSSCCCMPVVAVY